MKCYLATSNAGKVREINVLAQSFNLTLAALPEGVPAPEEPFATFIENALHKARFYSKLLAAPVLAEDSGLCVPALHGAPGVFTARYAEMNSLGMNVSTENRDEQNNQTLLANLAGVAQRQAYFVCYAVSLKHEHDPAPLIAQGFWHGQIHSQPQGINGFGYDPIFYVPTHQCTAAMLTSEQKQAVSHRGQAFGDLFALMKQADQVTE